MEDDGNGVSVCITCVTSITLNSTLVSNMCHICHISKSWVIAADRVFPMLFFLKHFNFKESFRQVLWKLWIFVWWRSCLCFPGSWMGPVFVVISNSFFHLFPDTHFSQRRKLSFVKSKFWDSPAIGRWFGKLQSAVFSTWRIFKFQPFVFGGNKNYHVLRILSVGRCWVDHGRFWRESRMWSLMRGKKTEPGGDARWIARTNWREEMWAGMRKCGKLKNRQSRRFVWKSIRFKGESKILIVLLDL